METLGVPQYQNRFLMSLYQIRLVKVGFRFDASLLGLCPCSPTLEGAGFNRPLTIEWSIKSG